MKELRAHGITCYIQDIKLPWKTYFAVRERIETDLKKSKEERKYSGISGMLLLADEINAEMKTTVHLGTLYTAGSALEKRDKVKLEWQKIDLPYEVYHSAKEKLVQNSNRYKGADGWITLKNDVRYPENDYPFFHAFQTREAKGFGWIINGS